jgi:hypothetical protein
MVLAVLFALPAMTAAQPDYPVYMVVLALGSASWFTYLAVRARALVGLLLVPVALIWLNPLLGSAWFTHEGPGLFLPHSALALLFGVAAYTFAATEKR